MNYTELVNAVKGYLENDFPTTTAASLTSTEQLNMFIKQAEQRIYNEVHILELRKNATTSVSIDNQYLTAPSDWLATYSLAVKDATGAYHPVINKDVNFIREAYPQPTDTGLPKYYALFDSDSMILGPTPDASYAVELHYFYYPQSIVDGATSWLGDNFDSALLYGTLLEAATFQQSDPDVMENYYGRYGEAMGLLEQLAEGKNRRDTYRTEQKRIPDA